MRAMYTVYIYNNTLQGKSLNWYGICDDKVLIDMYSLAQAKQQDSRRLNSDKLA